MVKTIKDRKKVTDKVTMFVVLEKGLLFLHGDAEPVKEDRISAELYRPKPVAVEN